MSIFPRGMRNHPLVDAFIKKQPPVVAGARGATPTLIAIRVTPPVPIEDRIAYTRFRTDIDAPYELLQAYTGYEDAQTEAVKGDLLVINGVEYPIQFVEHWAFYPGWRIRFLVEKVDA